MDISGLADEYRLAAGKPMLLYLKRPAPELEPRLKGMIDGIRATGTVSYRTVATPRELERLLADDLAVLLSESFAGAAVSTGARGGRAGGMPARRSCRPGRSHADRHRGVDAAMGSVPEAMEAALKRHNRLVTGVIEEHDGVVVTSRGKGTASSRCFPARWPRSRRSAPASSGSVPRTGRRGRDDR